MWVNHVEMFGLPSALSEFEILLETVEIGTAIWNKTDLAPRTPEIEFGSLRHMQIEQDLR